MSNKNRIQTPQDPKQDSTDLTVEPAKVEMAEDTAATDTSSAVGDTQEQSADVAADTAPAVETVTTPAAAPVAEKPVEPPAAVEEAKPAERVLIIGAGNAVPPIPHDDFALTAGASTSARLVVDELNDYITKMNVKKIIDPVSGAAIQTGLYRALLGAVNTAEADFKEVMTLTLAMVHKYSDTVFHAANVNRFSPHTSLPAPTAQSFRQLINLFTALADPESRALAAKQINFEATLGHRSIAEDARQRVLSFFHVSV